MTKAIGNSPAIPFKLPLKAGAPGVGCAGDLIFRVSVGANTSLTLPIDTNNLFTVDYGDGSSKLMVSGDVTDINATHLYVNAGTYIITITGYLQNILNNNDFKDYLIDVLQWGLTGLQSISLSNCTNLISLPDDILGSFTKITMFNYCFDSSSSLTTIGSNIFKYAVNCTDFSFCFGDDTGTGCTSLAAIPSGLFDNNVNVINFYGTFAGCSSLAAIPSGLFDNNVNVTTFNKTFGNCSSLAAIPSGLFDNNVNVNDFFSCFTSTAIVAIPLGLFDFNVNVTNFEQTFFACSIITAIPLTLFDNCILVNNFRYTFAGCSNLIGNCPTLWLTFPGADGTGCFQNCFTLTNYPAALAAGWA
jgi:hypothetical protein